MRTLLVASDLSSRSDRAVAQAAYLAGRFGARLVLLHVVDDELPAALFDAGREQAIRLLAETASGSGFLSPDRVAVRVDGGLDFRTILAVAAEEGAGLIVLGAHRRSLLEDVLTGTTVERVIRNAATPVLVARRSTPGGYVCTLAAVDLKEEETAVLRLAHRLADGQTLYLTHVQNDALSLRTPLAGARSDEMERSRRAIDARCEAALQDIARLAGLPAGGWLPLVGWGSPAEEILDGVERLHADLCVVGTRTRGRGAVERLLFGSVAERLLLDLTCDVLVVPLSGAEAPAT
ncbi:universal stress protein [Azospirillum thermophilum]|uniref:UspA domain-containing protein n=1 Tax=Azospirillum thermophilum TaxID=2202148 RepID=A0A2S2CPQ2_9PROT|nr:universal stress protein [Azospirillum thermophilum]AWK86503.1 hypothetical protein DEW08_09850 [Azospirillum thermophilum]